MTTPALTAIPANALWTQMSGPTIMKVNKSMALAHFTFLVLGFVNPLFWKFALGAALVDTLTILVLVKFRVFSIPGQVRLLYTAMLGATLSVPLLHVLFAPMAAGMATFVTLDICPMARTVRRFPWNRAPNPAPEAAPASA